MSRLASEAGADDLRARPSLPGEVGAAGDEFFRRLADEIRQAGGGEQAAADAAGEAATRPGEDGDAHPERIRRGGVGAVGHRVEEQVGERIAREVARVGQLGREDEAGAGDALALSPFAQALVGFRRVVEQPENAVLRLAR